MKLSSWLSNLVLRMTSKSYRYAKRRRRSQLRTRIEALECRTLLSGANVITVTTLSDDVQHTGVSLRDAITETNAAAPGYTINFDSNLNGMGTPQITLKQGQIDITNSVTINGLGANVLTISGNYLSRIFDINSPTGIVTISGFTFAYGKATGDGGAIRDSDTKSFNLALIGDAFYGNSATGYGGAVFSFGGSSTNDTFLVNQALYGGALATGDYPFASVNDTFFNNTATSDGGAIYVQAGQFSTMNDTITANNAENGGGIVATGLNGSVWNGLNTIVAGNLTLSHAPSDLYKPTAAPPAPPAPPADQPPPAASSSSPVFSASNSLIGDAASAAAVGITTSGNNIIGASASSIFVTAINGFPYLAANGASTGSVALVPGSPAIEAGTSLGTLPGPLDSSQTSFSFVVPSGESGAFPYYIAVGQYLKIDSEILLVTGTSVQSTESGTTFTITALRGQIDTTAAAHAQGAIISLAFDQSGKPRPLNDIGSYAFVSRSAPTVTVTDAGGVFNNNPYPATGTVTGNGGPPSTSLQGVDLIYMYYTGNTATGSASYTAPRNAGTYTVVAMFPGSLYYTAESQSTTFTITKAAPTVAVTAGSGVYTGSPFTASGTVTGVSGTPDTTLEGVGLTYTYYTGTTASGTPLPGAPAYIGTYTVVASFPGSTDYASASSSTTFTISSSSSPIILDDTSSGFSTSGSWTKATGSGYDNDYLYSGAGTGSSQATWSFTGLQAGQYAIFATWAPYANRATNAPFTVLSSVGGSVLATTTVDQQLTPNSLTNSGTTWQAIGIVTITGSTLVVRLNNQANNYVIADAVQLQRLGAPPQTVVTDGTTNILRYGSDNFGTVTQGSTAVTKTITVTNSGNTDLTLQPATATADSGFTITSNFTADQVVAPGASATMQVQMDSSTIGSQSATVSFTSSDSANSPFTFTVSGTVTGNIMDDTSPGFSTTGTWTKVTGAGYDNDYLYSAAGNGSSKATWDFTGLQAGQYDVAVTWVPYSNRATNAQFSILDGVGGNVLATATVNQQRAPLGIAPSLVGSAPSRQSIGTVIVVGSTLVVQLSNQADGYVIADAVEIQRIGNLPQTLVSDGKTIIANFGSDNFGTVTQGSKPVTRTITVTNSGETDLTLQPATVAPNSGFTITSNFTANQVVAPGATASLQIQMDTSSIGTPSAGVSFTSSDSANSPFTFTVNGTVTGNIMDDTSAGFSTTGTWSKATGAGYGNDYLYSATGNGSSKATWDFTGLQAGQYAVSATWVPYSNRATNAQFSMLDGIGGKVLATATVNEQQAPGNMVETQSIAGTSWQTIGTVNIVGSTLVVQLSNQANNYVIADAIQLERLGNVPQTIVTDGTTNILNNGSDNFGTVTQGSTAVTRTITVTNSGETDLTLQPATVTPDSGFTITSNFTADQVVAPGATATLQVQMATSNFGAQSATVSFASSDSANSPFTFTVNGTISGVIVDDTSTGFSTTGTWTKATGDGYNNDYLYAAAGTGSQANWNFTGLQSGQYVVYATWVPYANRATNAPFTVLSSVGGSVLAQASVNEQLAPSGISNAGADWQAIGTINVLGSTVVVQLKNQANNYVIADAIQLQRLGAVPQMGVSTGTTVIPNGGGFDFGTATQGSASVTKTFTITNSGETDLVLQPATITSSSGFTISSNFTTNQTVAPGGTATLQVQMHPSIPGSKSALVSISNSDSANNPFTFNVTGTVTGMIMDDTSSGFSTTGTWSKATGAGYNNDYLYAAAGNGSSQATWSFTGLNPGQYLVSATWLPYSNRATDAPFTVLSSVGGTVLASADLNQQKAPADTTDAGTTWQTIGTVTITGSTLVVRLNNQANNYVIADAIRLEQIPQ